MTDDISAFRLAEMPTSPGEMASALPVASSIPSDTCTELPKSPYPKIAEQLTQAGPAGIRFDFNQGARIVVPPLEEGKWRVRLCDLDTDNILFESRNAGATVLSANAILSASASTSGGRTPRVLRRACSLTNSMPAIAKSSCCFRWAH